MVSLKVSTVHRVVVNENAGVGSTAPIVLCFNVYHIVLNESVSISLTGLARYGEMNREMNTETLGGVFSP